MTLSNCKMGIIQSQLLKQHAERDSFPSMPSWKLHLLIPSYLLKLMSPKESQLFFKIYKTTECLRQFTHFLVILMMATVGVIIVMSVFGFKLASPTNLIKPVDTTRCLLQVEKTKNYKRYPTRVVFFVHSMSVIMNTSCWRG